MADVRKLSGVDLLNRVRELEGLPPIELDPENPDHQEALRAEWRRQNAQASTMSKLDFARWLSRGPEPQISDDKLAELFVTGMNTPLEKKMPNDPIANLLDLSNPGQGQGAIGADPTFPGMDIEGLLKLLLQQDAGGTLGDMGNFSTGFKALADRSGGFPQGQGGAALGVRPALQEKGALDQLMELGGPELFNLMRKLATQNAQVSDPNVDTGDMEQIPLQKIIDLLQSAQDNRLLQGG
jgi:hypothetical protein